jgi:hypothetical protein
MEEWQLAVQILSISSRDGSNWCRNRDSLAYLGDEVSFPVVVRYCWKTVNNTIIQKLGEKPMEETDIGRFMV